MRPVWIFVFGTRGAAPDPRMGNYVIRGTTVPSCCLVVVIFPWVYYHDCRVVDKYDRRWVARHAGPAVIKKEVMSIRKQKAKR